MSGPRRIPTCDRCSAPAAHITHHERPNTGPLVAYWCERHYAANQQPAADATVDPVFPVMCPHGRHVGWARRDDPATISSRRFCAPCPECDAAVTS